MRKIALTIEKDPDEEAPKPQYYYCDGEWRRFNCSADEGDVLCETTDYEVRVVRLDDAVIETAFTNSYSLVSRWLRYIDRDHRKRRSPLLLSLSFHTADVSGRTYRHSSRTRTEYPARFKNPISYVSLCVGGSHCLVFDISDPNWDPEKLDSPIRRLLEDRRISVVGIGMKRFAEHARDEWGVEVANPVDLISVAQEAFGDCHVRAGMEVEEIAEVVLGGMKLKRKPKRVADLEWGFYEEMTEEMLMYETSDAYLAFEIGKKCFKMTGRKI